MQRHYVPVVDKDIERFNRVLWPHADVVLRTAKLLVRDDWLAEDLAQETMFKAFRAMHTFADATDARAWLLAILRNVRIDRLRSDKRRRGDVSLDAMPAEPIARASPGNAPALSTDLSDPSGLMEQIGDKELIDALIQLPEHIRWALLLVDVEGLSMVDAGVVMDVPPGTVKSRCSRGRAMLREVITDVRRIDITTQADVSRENRIISQ